jgi:capsular polysaccharide transport system permease protein
MLKVDPSLPSFLQSMQIQYRVIRALMLREIIFRFGRRNIGFLWLFAEPLFFVVAIVFFRSYIRQSGFETAHYGINLIAFVLTGYCLAMVWRNACNKGSDAVSASAPLLHHRNIKTVDLYLSRLFLEFFGLTLVFFGLLFLLCMIGLMPWPEDLLLMITAWLLMLWFALGYGLLFGSIMALFETFAILWRVVNFGLFFISGVFFFVVWLPVDLRELVLWVPMIHGTEMLRHGYYGNLVQTFESPMYLITWNLVLSFLGFIAIRSPRLIDSMEQGSA